jgi:hypothetical protein
MPGDPGATVVTNARAYYSTRAAAGATGTRHSPLPLGVAPRPPFQGERFLHNSGVSRRGNAAVRLRAPDAAQRAALAAWCAADPGSMLRAGCLWVPALRCIVKNAAPRPGHGVASPAMTKLAV